MASWTSGSTVASRKVLTARRMTYGDVNEKLYQWFIGARGKNLPVSGRMLQDQAAILASEMGHTDFCASNGWLRSFQQRHGIHHAVLSGEAADVDPNTVSDWSHRLPDICKGFAKEDIFNADETGLFYRTMPNKSMVLKGANTSNGKLAKERVTVLLAASAAGEKLKPLVIGKSANPRCFSRCKRDQLGVVYEANRKAWMTSEIFTRWLRRLNNQMSLQSRNILLFLDNCGAHPSIELSHVKLYFFPPNTTSRLQPMDAGIIQTVKLHYRKKMMRHVAAELDEVSTASEVARSITVLHAIQWLESSWNLVESSTIEKCFKKSGFFAEDSSASGEDVTPREDDDLVPLLRLVPGTTAKDLVEMDEATSTHSSQPEEESSTTDAGSLELQLERESSDEDEPEPAPLPTFKKAHNDIEGIMALALKHNSTSLLKMASSMKEELENLCLANRMSSKQTVMEDFFA